VREGGNGENEFCGRRSGEIIIGCSTRRVHEFNLADEGVVVQKDAGEAAPHSGDLIDVCAWRPASPDRWLPQAADG
jgi:hypothetical protein